MATIRDVARRANVSIATVSRVLNSSSRVSEESRARVWRAARDLDFWPNSAARSLTTSRTQAIGVLLPDLYGEFYSEIIRGMDRAAREARFQILISSSHADTDELLSAAISMQGRIDGLVIMAPDHGSASAIDRVRRRFPLVLLNPRHEIEGCSTFAIANFEGGLAITNHLLEFGHRSIAVVTGPPDNADAVGRLAGYRRALLDVGIEPEPDWEIGGDFSEASGYDAADRLLQISPRPTAVFAANDSMALGLMAALHERSVAIPDDVSVAGFDDIAIARYATPSLTTVHVDAFDLGRQAVERLVSELENPDDASPRHEVLATDVVVRRSCAMADPSPVHNEAAHPDTRDERETRPAREKKEERAQ